MNYKNSIIIEKDILKGCLKDLNDAFVSIRANCIGGVPSQIAAVRDRWIKELITVEKELADIEVKEKIEEKRWAEEMKAEKILVDIEVKEMVDKKYETSTIQIDKEAEEVRSK